MFRLFKIYQFLQEASTYRDLDEAVLKSAGAEAERHANYHRIIVRISCIFGAIGFLLGVALLVMTMTTLKPEDTKNGNGANNVLLAPFIFAISGLLFGVAISCLFAPREFLLGPNGHKWMTLIGTKNTIVARFVCCLLALIVGGAPLGMGLFIYLTSK